MKEMEIGAINGGNRLKEFEIEVGVNTWERL